MAETTILFKAEVDSAGAISGMKQVETSLKGVGSSAGEAKAGVGGLNSGLGAGLSSFAAYAAGAITITTVMAALRKSIEAAAAAQLAQVKLEAMVQATGKAAGYTAGELSEMATRMQMLTGINDETVKGAQAVLLTYRNIGPQAFEPALRAASNLAAIMDGDLASAARAVGMAMEDPAEGMLRLRRSGVLLSQAVQDNIKDFQAHGRLMEAQNLLLAEVDRRAKDLAERMGNTFAGNLRKNRAAWGDVIEAMGAFVVESKNVNASLKETAGFVENMAQNVDTFRKGGFGPLQSLLMGLTGAVMGWNKEGYTAKVPVKEQASAWSVGPFGQDYVNDIAAGVAAEKALNDEAEKFNRSLEAQVHHLETQEEILIRTRRESEKLAAIQEKMLQEAFRQNRAFQGSEAGSYWADFGISQAEVDPDLATKTLAAMKTKWVSTHTGDELGKQFGQSFADGFLTIFQGDKVQDALAGIMRGLGGLAARQLGEGLAILMGGGGIEAAGMASGLWNVQRDAQGNIIPGSGKFNTWGAVGMAGGVIGSYGQARQNTTMGALGGAMSGAAMGAQFGSVVPGVGTAVGAVVGAVLGGVMGYLSSQGAKAKDYRLQYGMGVGAAMLPGQDYAQEKLAGESIKDRYREVSTSFRDLLYLMKAGLGELPSVGGVVEGKTLDANAVLNTLLKGILPRAIAESYRPLLATAMGGLGIGEGRAELELGKLFSGGDFDKAMTALTAYVGAVVGLTDLHGELSKSLDELKADVAKGLVETWRESSVKTLENLGRLSEGLENLTSEEQVKRAQEIADAAREGLNAARQTLQNIEQTRESLAQSIGQYQLTRQLAGVTEPTGQAAILQGRFAEALAGAAGAKSTEDLSKFMGEALGYGQQLIELADQIAAQAEALSALSEDFTSLTADLTKPVSELMDELTSSGRGKFQGTAADAVAKILELRQGLEGLAPTDMILRLGQIRDLTRTTYENNLAYLRDIVNAQASVRATFEGFFQSIAEAEAEKAGPAALGQYYVDQLADLQTQLNAAMDPAVIEDLMQQAASWASKLYGMSGEVAIGGQDVLAWLKPFMEMLQAVAQGKLGTEAGLVGDTNKNLADSLAGLQDTIDTGATGLQLAAENLRKLIDEQLALALATADGLLDQWAGEVQTAIDAMGVFVGGMLDALMGEDVAGLKASLGDLGDKAGGAADGLDRVRYMAECAAAALGALTEAGGNSGGRWA